jgi:ribosomal protein L11 methyltransferase
MWPAIDLAVRPHASPPPDIGDRIALAADDAAAVAIEDDGSNLHWRLHFGDAAVRDHARQVIQDALGQWCDVGPIDVEDEGWVIKVQNDLRAIRAGRIVVSPPWDVEAIHEATDPLTAQDTVLIVIEPSTGFGTGHHQSTRLCLEALQQMDLSGLRVIDLGTGSGVLALASVRLGASEVLAVDHDPDSVSAARENTVRNGLESAVRVQLADLNELRADPARMVVANLTAWLIRRHADAILPLVLPGGQLVVSGFTLEQVPLVTDALPSMVVERRFEEDDWVGLVLRAAS